MYDEYLNNIIKTEKFHSNVSIDSDLLLDSFNWHDSLITEEQSHEK